jgi:hypothetical protein
MNRSNVTNSPNPAPFLNPPAPKNSSPNVALYGATGVAISLFCGFMIYKMLKSGVNRVANSNIIMAAVPIHQEPATVLSTSNSSATGIVTSNRSV